MNDELICPSCATPIEVPKKFAGTFLVCPNCGVPLDIQDDGTMKESYLGE